MYVLPVCQGKGGVLMRLILTLLILTLPATAEKSGYSRGMSREVDPWDCVDLIGSCPPPPPMAAAGPTKGAQSCKLQQ